MNEPYPTRAEPTLKQLRYFTALAEHLHFADAAAVCGVSQPNLSSQIRELENDLGGQLVERTSRQVLLTPLGERVLERARRVLAEVDDLMDLTIDASGPFSGRVRLGVIPTIAPYVLPRALPKVRSKWPQLELQLIEDFTEKLVPRLVQGELDVVLMALPVEQAGLDSQPLADEPFVVLAPNDHPITKSKKVRTAEFEPADLLLLQEGHCLRDQALDVCHLQANHAPNPVEGASLSMLVQMVANGFGLTLLPLIAVPVDLPATNEVRVLPFTKPEPGRTLGLVWRKTSPRAAEYRELAAVLQQEVMRLLAEARAMIQ
jgi:LysR family hydrogen peroxide-inducible transcriptional activator